MTQKAILYKDTEKHKLGQWKAVHIWVIICIRVVCSISAYNATLEPNWDFKPAIYDTHLLFKNI